MKKIVLTFMALILSGCATAYKPIPEGYSGPKSTISDSYSNKESTKAHYFILYKLDGKYVDHSWSKTRGDNYGKGMNFTPSIVTRQVLPKEQIFTLQGLVFFPTDGQQLFGNDMSVTKDFTFTPKVGETYTVRGKLDKSGSSVWLENSAGEVVEGSLGKSAEK